MVTSLQTSKQAIGDVKVSKTKRKKKSEKNDEAEEDCC